MDRHLLVYRWPRGGKQVPVTGLPLGTVQSSRVATAVDLRHEHCSQSGTWGTSASTGQDMPLSITPNLNM